MFETKKNTPSGEVKLSVCTLISFLFLGKTFSRRVCNIKPNGNKFRKWFFIWNVYISWWNYSDTLCFVFLKALLIWLSLKNMH